MSEILSDIVNTVPWWVRLILAIVFLALGALIAWFISIRLGLLLFVAGFILLCFSGRSDSEKNGYNF